MKSPQQDQVSSPLSPFANNDNLQHNPPGVSDHRDLGRQLDLFHFQDDAPGAVFWHPRGWRIFQKLVSFLRNCLEEAGYEEIASPTLMERRLWEQSGHWDKFGSGMFVLEKEGRDLALKPMNCPGAVQVFNQGVVSYRQLPMRLAEFGKVHRFEPSGSLHGLMRVREFVQDDAHIFCRQDQLHEECRKIIDLILAIYRAFGFHDIRLKFSDRPEKRIGDDAIWDRLEGAIVEVLEGLALPYEVQKGEGAFYGPKIEFVLRDAHGRQWQCGVIQVDMNLPERFDLSYVDADNSRQRPVMLHRALFGSLERFIGILLEHHEGKLPLWLAPEQAVVIPVAPEHADYAASVAKELRSARVSARIDNRNESLGYRIREAIARKAPALVVVGNQELAAQLVSVRMAGEKIQKQMPLEDARRLLGQLACEPSIFA